MEEEIHLIAIEVGGKKFYIANKKGIGDEYFREYLERYLFDGKKSKPTFLKGWVLVDKLPERISEMNSQSNINYRFELQDKSLLSKKIPLVILKEDVVTKEDSYVWKEDMAQYRSLYVENSDEQPDIEVGVPFTIETIMEVSEIVKPSEFGYIVPRSQWTSDGMKEITEDDVNYKLIERIFYPDILLPQRPCFFTSEQSYKIVRQYVKDNIDAKYAVITSDYDFCFTVKRRIPLSEFQTYSVDVNFMHNMLSKRQRKPKYVQKQKKEREEECFAMSWSPKAYSGYTPIQGFEADTQENLKEKVDNYCKELIKFINKSFIDCKNCKGDGVVILEQTI